MNKYTMEMAWKTLYNVRDPPKDKDQKNSEEKQKENYCSIATNNLPETTI